MGQIEIINLLKKEKKWLSTKEIEKMLNVSSISRPLSVLLKTGEVLQRKIKVGLYYVFQWKIKKANSKFKPIKRSSRKTCIVCEKPIIKGTNRGVKSKRHFTCSKPCAKRYEKIMRFILNPYAARIKKLERKMKNIK